MAATGVDLTNGNVFKTVATEAQAVALEAIGWVRVGSDTASDTTALGEFPSIYEDFTNPGNPAFRGAGVTGEGVTTLGYYLKKSSVSMTADQLQLLIEAVGNRLDSVDETFTSFSVVSVLPTTTSISHTTIYILDTYDSVATLTGASAGIPVGMMVTNITDNYNAWLEYTPA